MSYTPKNNFNLQLKRTDAGEVGFRKKLLADVACCNDPHYQFYSDFNEEALDPGSSMTITVKGGCSPFAWSVSGSDFTLTNANTEGRENTISSAFDTGMSIREIVTVTDACSNTTEIIVTNCELFSEFSDNYTGVLWACGSDANDQITITGLGINKTFTLVDAEERIGVYHCGRSFSIIITKDAILKGTGKNDHGQLGLGDTINRSDFTIIDANQWQRVSGGSAVSLALRLNGDLYGTGWNSRGELGLGDTNERISFTFILSDVDKISLTSTTSLIIKTDGTLWGAGKNVNGELGLNEIVDKNIFTQIGGATDWKDIATGNSHTAILTTAGLLYTSGYNYHGQLGLGDNTTRLIFTLAATDVEKVFAGYTGTYIIKTNGTLWSTGDNSIGQLGVGDIGWRNSFTQVGSDTDWKIITASISFAFAMKTNGTIYGTGLNENGQLGLGDTTNRNVFTLVPDFICKNFFIGNTHTFVVREP